MQTLKGAAFEWYSKLLPGSIADWEAMKSQFLARFYNTRRTVSLSELTITKQKSNERAADFITRWRNLSIHCSQTLLQQEAVKICMANLHPWLSLNLQSLAPTTFELLSTRATEIEIYLDQNPAYLATLKAQLNPSVVDKSKKALPKNVSTINIKGGEKSKSNDNAGKQSKGKTLMLGDDDPKPPQLTLEERKAKEYPFRDDKVPKLFKHALDSGHLKLPAPKKPDEVNKTDDTNYCLYHRFLGHKIEDCWVFKDWLMAEFKAGRITFSQKVLKNSQTCAANVVTISGNDELEYSSSDDDEGATNSFGASDDHGSAE